MSFLFNFDDYGRKNTKNIRYFAQNQAFKHKFSKKNSLFFIFCLFFEMNILYLLPNRQILIKKFHFNKPKL